MFPDKSGVVRKVRLVYKNYRVGEKLVEYRGGAYQDVIRPVQRLALIVPVDSAEDLEL